MKALMSIVVTADGRVSATYMREVLGATAPTSKNDKWPDQVRDAAKNLIKVADDLSADDPSVSEVQLYGPDAGGKTEHAEAGDLVDVKFMGGSGFRAGDVAPVPSALASARDALKAAVEAAL